MIRLRNDFLKMFLQDVLKTFWKDVLARRLEDVLKTFLQDVLKVSWRHLENVLKTSWRRMTKTNILVLTKTSWRRLQDVFWRRRRKTSSRPLHLFHLFIKTYVCWVVIYRGYIWLCPYICEHTMVYKISKYITWKTATSCWWAQINIIIKTYKQNGVSKSCKSSWQQNNQSSKLKNRNWVEVNDEALGRYNTNRQIKFKVFAVTVMCTFLWTKIQQLLEEM